MSALRELQATGGAPALSAPEPHALRTPAASRYVRLAKPVLDAAGAAVLLVLLAPVLALAAAAIALTMGRPVLFRQQRVGRHGQCFTVYKLRTMRHDPALAAELLRPGPDGRILHKRADDPRITPLGRVLRRWNIDELPQLVNVLQGHMSLVGPRPELPEIVARYEPWQHERHLVKPGITGLWQVSARNDKPMHERTELDVDYVRRMGFLQDVRLLLWTVPASFGRQRGL